MTKDYFRKIRRPGCSDFEWECKICGKHFPETDITGRENEIGRNAHISKHVKEKMRK